MQFLSIDLTKGGFKEESVYSAGAARIVTQTPLETYVHESFSFRGMMKGEGHWKKRTKRTILFRWGISS
jgi:hypothetical protein